MWKKPSLAWKGQKLVWRKPTRKELIITGLVMLALISIVVSGYLFLRRKQSVTLTGTWFQSHAGIRETYTGELKLTWKDGTTTMKYDGKTIYMDGYPLYQKDKTKLVLPATMLWVQQDSEEYNRVEYFSTLQIEADGVTIQDGSRKEKVNEGFLYDGGDVYVFLEPVTLSWGDMMSDIPAGSTVVARYDNDLTIFGCDAGVYYEEIDYTTDVTAEFASGEGVLLTKDRLQKANGSWQLIPVAPDLFDRIGG